MNAEEMEKAQEGATIRRISRWPIPCPFVYSRGKRRCTGHIVKVDAYKADLEWAPRKEGTWRIGWEPRSHYHLFCSEKGNHAGAVREDAVKLYWDGLPEQLRNAMLAADGQ